MEESHSGYCTCLENKNPLPGSWVRVPPPPPTQFTIGVNPFSRAPFATRELASGNLSYIIVSYGKEK